LKLVKKERLTRGPAGREKEKGKKTLNPFKYRGKKGQNRAERDGFKNYRACWSRGEKKKVRSIFEKKPLLPKQIESLSCGGEKKKEKRGAGNLLSAEKRRGKRPCAEQRRGGHELQWLRAGGKGETGPVPVLRKKKKKVRSLFASPWWREGLRIVGEEKAASVLKGRKGYLGERRRGVEKRKRPFPVA